MSEISIQLDTTKLDHLRAAGGAALVREVLGTLAFMLQRDAQTSMQGLKSGRRYTIPDTKIRYTASAPGQTPAIVTGHLKNSIQAEPVGTGLKTWVVRVGAEYSAELEFGTMRVRPRPFLRPAFERTRQKVDAVVRRAFQAAL
jgi:HK97 gp10 family phage protein